MDTLGMGTRRLSRIIVATTIAVLSTGVLIGQALPAAATSGIQVFVGYADSLRADPQNFPTPWSGSPNAVFRGCAPVANCIYDSGAVRVVNNSSSTVTVDAVAVHVDTCTFTGWQGATLAPGADLIVTQQAASEATGCNGPAQMDSSDMGPGGRDWTGQCVPDGILPTVDVTINGQTTHYTDSGQVLNTGGIDTGICQGNESTQWTVIGHAPCKGSLLTLAPQAQTHGIGSTATVTATFTNSCGQPLSDVSVQFTIPSGPNAGRTGTATTDANGNASFTYSSAVTGTDTLQAAVTNLAGHIDSNTVTVTWLPFAPGGGAFVISDLKDVSNGAVYWWGAQWWKKDPTSTGLAPASFKGFEKSNPLPMCGQTWTTRPGNSPKPPKTVPAYMLVIVTSHVTKKGPVISGNIVHIVLVRTNAGYGPNPGHPGTGTIVSTLC